MLYGKGAMNPTAIKEAVKAEFPMDKFVSIWWPNDPDAASAGDGAKGFKELNWHSAGANFPALADIQEPGRRPGKSQTPKDQIGQVLYNRGVYNSMLIAEAIAEAQKITGKKVVPGKTCAAAWKISTSTRRVSRRLASAVRQPGQDDLRRSQQPFGDLRPAIGQRGIGKGQRSHRPG